MKDIAQKLRSLPHAAAAPYDWAEFKARTAQRRDIRLRAAGIAAGFALIIAGLAVWSRFDNGLGAVNAQTEPEAPMTESWAHARPPDEEQNDARTLHPQESSSPAAHARDASQWLASLPSEPTVVRVNTRFAVTDLEDRIAWLDDLLTAAAVESVQPDHIKTLRRERAQLVDSLAQVRYAETLAAELP